MTRRGFVFVAVALLSCRSPADTALGAAERFLDAHYVRIDLDAARALCTGIAAQKIADEQELTRGQIIDESTRQPRVNYRLLQTRDGDESRVSFLFEGTIRVQDAGAFTRRWLVTARSTSSGWRVSNYHEFE